MASNTTSPTTAPPADAMAPPPPPPPPPAPTSASTSASTPHALLKSLSLKHSSRSLFRPRPRSVQLEFTLDECVVLPSETGSQKRETLRWQDVLGAQFVNEQDVIIHVDRTTKSARSYTLALFACPAKHTKPNKLKRRKVKEWHFQFPADQLDDVLALRDWINYLADPRSLEEMQRAQSLDDLTVDTGRANRKFLVIINPVGGAGKGVQTYEKKVAPVFKYANIDATVQLTERAQHGQEMARNLPLNTYDCLISIGGDGTLSEVFQGLMQREDWAEAIQQPIGVVPGGSGNGLFASIVHELGERFDANGAAFVLAKGLPRPLDVSVVRNPHGDVMYSFLSTEWALIADVDIESESLRALGGARFTVKMLQHLMVPKQEYHGTIWYLEEDAATESCKPWTQGSPLGFDLFENMEEGAQAADGSAAHWRKLDGHFHIVWTMNVTHAASDAIIAPGAQLSDGYNYLMVLEGSYPRKDLVNLVLSLENGTQFVKTPGAKFIKTRAFKLIPTNENDRICVDGEIFKGPIDTQVHHNVARIVTLPGKTDSTTP